MNSLSIRGRTQKRLRHHLIIAPASFALTGLFYAVLFYFYPDSQRWIFRLSMATAYAATVLLAATLSFGAWNVLRRKVNPVSGDLRRDTGIWCAVFSLLHVAFGLNVHLKNWTQYFIDDAGNWRADAFGSANYLGVLATLIVIMLLATSNDVSLRYFGRERWKTIQRSNYIFVLLVAAHGVVYQAVEKRIVPFIFIFGAILLWTATVQSAGFQKKRRETQAAKIVAQS